MTLAHPNAVQTSRASRNLTGPAVLPNPNWPDPTPSHLADPRFDAIWRAIRSWDINVPEAYQGYCGATGNHVRAILDALNRETLVSELVHAVQFAGYTIDRNDLRDLLSSHFSRPAGSPEPAPQSSDPAPPGGQQSGLGPPIGTAPEATTPVLTPEPAPTPESSPADTSKDPGTN